MYLKKLSLHNFKCFEDIDIDFDKKLTVIVGSNGAGKTAILESAAIAISAMFMSIDDASSKTIDRSQAHLKAFAIDGATDVQPQYPVNIIADAVDGQNNIHWERSLNTSKGATTYGKAKEMIDFSDKCMDCLRNGDQNLILPVLAYYDSGRLWDYHREKQNAIFGSNNRANGYIDSIGGTANVKLMMNWFKKMTIQKYQNQEIGLGVVPELEAVFAAMEGCYKRITDCDYVKIQYNMGTQELDVTCKDNDGNTMRIPMSQLSDGYKSIISLVADIAYRMAVLNPQLLGHVCTKTDGIVLIDEVDLHLHPEWQQRISRDLTAIFPNVQFIVTTHAVPVISSAKSENLRILKNHQIKMAHSQIFGNDTYRQQKSKYEENLPIDFDMDVVLEQLEDYGRYNGLSQWGGVGFENYIPVSVAQQIIRARGLSGVLGYLEDNCNDK